MGKRFVLVAGLVTSTCTLSTAGTATQLGYLVAVVDDCCADLPSEHDRVLRSYHPFMFGITCSDGSANTGRSGSAANEGRVVGPVTRRRNAEPPAADVAERNPWLSPPSRGHTFPHRSTGRPPDA